MRNNLISRQIVILVGSNDWLEQQVSSFYCLAQDVSRREQYVWLNQDNFFKAKNLLGQEFDFIVYDARQSFNLEAMAIASGTLRGGGTLLILFNYWQNLVQREDLDSLRWSNEAQAISTPHFIQFFQRKVVEYKIPIYQQSMLDSVNINIPCQTSDTTIFMPTSHQQFILDEILKQQVDIYIVIAKRGRGKSVLAALLSKVLLESQQVILTAPNKSAVKILQNFAQNTINFNSPDELCAQIQQNPELFRHNWLIIDEAAMIPIDLLTCLTSAFKHILFTTTIHSYEGTGRGFLLKFITQIDRTYQQFTLHEPLRWSENDILERFIDDLLLLDCEDRLFQTNYGPNVQIQIKPILQQELIREDKIESIYSLLMLAHYRTTPLDLRRLFDASQQKFYLAENGKILVGCVWGIEEGGLLDFNLMTDICHGIRRPKGNLVAQALAFYSNLPQACELQSLRISRIAIQPNWQHQGIGQRLVAKIIQDAKVDFVSVSFGYTRELAEFWYKCGFIFVHLGEHKEASSGCYSAIALYPISWKGQELLKKAEAHFRRNIGFSFHALANHFKADMDWHLTEDDWTILQNFADFNRTLFSSLGAIKRLIAIEDKDNFPLLRDYCENQGVIKNSNIGKKTWLANCRLEVKRMLQKYKTVL